MRTGLSVDNIIALRKADRRAMRNKILLVFSALTVLFFIFLSLRTTEIGLISPLQTVSNTYTAIKIKLAEIFKWQIYENRLAITGAQPYYLETLTRLESGLLAIALGAAVSVTGAVYQSAFRNPIGSPAMLGISGGVRIANIILVMMYTYGALSMTRERYILGYAISLALLALIMIFGRIMGGKKGSVTDMLLIGSIVTRLTGSAITAIQTYYMSEDSYLILQQLNLYGSGLGSTQGVSYLTIAVVLGITPVVLLRFSLNAVVFEDDDSKCLGVNAGRLRMLCLVCSTVLMVAAQIHLGDVATLTLLVPHICRYIFGSDMKSLIPGCILVGGLFMLSCKVLTGFFAYNQFLMILPVSYIVDLIAAPVLIMILLRNRRGWQ